MTGTLEHVPRRRQLVPLPDGTLAGWLVVSSFAGIFANAPLHHYSGRHHISIKNT